MAGKSDDKKNAEVLATTADAVKLDSDENMSYADYARQRGEAVVTVQRIIDHRAKPPEMAKTPKPNMEIKQEVIWGAAPPEPPLKPDRVAATVTSYVMHRAPPPKPPRKGIGSMEPQGPG